MALDAVREYMAGLGLDSRIVVQATPSDTVEHAAAAVGCLPAQIAKTIAAASAQGPLLVVTSGDTKVSNKKYRAAFGEKLSMIPRDDVERSVGHAPGGVCPFANPSDVHVFLDESLRRFGFVYVAAGAPNATVRLTIPELESASRFVSWVDVCDQR